MENLNLTVCTVNNCTSFRIYLSAEELINLEELNLIESKLLITNIFSGDFYEFDVLEFLPELVEEEILLTTINFPNYEDGKYKIKLISKSEEETYQTEFTFISLCKTRCCIDKLWIKYSENCNCKCSDKTYEMAIQAEALYKLVVNGSSCDNEDSVLEILKKLNRICKLENCNCN